MYGPLGTDIEYVFVDDCSTDNTLSWLNQRRGAHFKVVKAPVNGGFSKAVNLGVINSTGQYIVLLNNDLLLTRDWFEPFKNLIDDWPAGLGVVGNVQRRVDGQAVDHSGVIVNAQGQLAHVQHIPHEDYTERDLLTGACMMFARSTYDQIGGLDEQFLNGAEDIDFCFKALSMGLKNRVLNNSQIFHHVGATRGTNPREYMNLKRLYGRWSKELSESMHRWQKSTGLQGQLGMEECTDCIQHELARIERQADFY